MTQELRCHRCSHFMGESSEPVEFTGLFKRTRDRAKIAEPRSAWLCPSCGWTNTFRQTSVDWREMQTKSP